MKMSICTTNFKNLAITLPLWVTLVLSTNVPAIAQLAELPVFQNDWHVAPSPDPERFRVENGSSLRFHGLLEVPYPASCAAFAKTSYLIDENSTLRLGFKRGKVTTDSLHFRYGFALFSRGTHIVLYHHLAPSWNGARGWTLQRNIRDAEGNAEMQQQPVFRLRDELIANCAPHSDADGIHISRKSAEQIREVSKFHPPKTAMFVSKWELYAWHRGNRWLDCRQAYNRLTDDGSQIVDVINGDIIDNIPDLLDRYDKIVVPYGDVIDEREQAALTYHAGKLVIESPEIFGQNVILE